MEANGVVDHEVIVEKLESGAQITSQGIRKEWRWPPTILQHFHK
jgi:hypothetical protein